MTLHAPPKPAAFENAAFDDPTIFYPDGDGKPMAESPEHLSCMVYGMNALTKFYAENPDVWVAGNNFIYYEMNQPTVRVSPDLYVVFGVSKKKRRRSFYTWREGNTAPSIVFEWTSQSTKEEDKVHKKALYEQVLRVPEYIMFDPIGDYLKPRLQGFRLISGVYAPIVPLSPNRLVSHVLGLEIVAHGNEIRFFDPVRGKYLDDYDTVIDRMADETKLRAEAEAENERLRAIIAQLTQAQTSGETETEESA